jgi:anti-sigma B factor antagonist
MRLSVNGVNARAFSPTVVHLCGELDMATAPALRDRLALIEGDIELDCSRLEFIDATGLAVFASANRQCAAQGAQFVLSRPPALLLRLLRITGLDEIITVRTSVGGDRDGARGR